MSIVYDSPIQFFAGNPSQGYSEPAFMELLGSLPTTWDETIIPAAQAGEYIATARKKEDNWYIGAMTNWTERDLTLTLDFLDTDAVYKATVCKDGTNANHYAADYVLDSFTVKNNDVLQIHMAEGGGYLLKLEKR